MDKTCLYGIEKVYTIIDYDDNNFFIFDHCKQHMPETHFGMKCGGFLQPIQIQIARVFKKFSWTYPPVFKDRLKRCKHENLSIPGYRRRKYMLHGRKSSTSNEMENGVTLP